MKQYLAGPMSGVDDANYPMFDRVAHQLRLWGNEVINPADLDRAAGEVHADGMEAWCRAMRRDLAALVTCEAIVLLPGWEGSKGARLEAYVADALGMERLYCNRQGYFIDPPTENFTTTPDTRTETWSTTPRSVLAEAEHLINGPRQESYSHPSEDYGRTVAMFNDWRGSNAGALTVEDGVMYMVFVKLSRQRHAHRRDNLVDASGYIGCLAKVVGEDA